MASLVDPSNGAQENAAYSGIEPACITVTNSPEESTQPKKSVRVEPKRRRMTKEGTMNFIRDNALILSTLIGIVVGFCVGIGLQELHPSPDLLQWIGLPGELFLRGLKATIVPVVICLVITATSSVDPTMNRKIAIVAISSYFLTAVIAVLTGVILFFIIQPGAVTISEEPAETFGTRLETQDIFLDLIRNILPDNIVGATIAQTTTVYTPEKKPGALPVNTSRENSLKNSDSINSFMNACTNTSIQAPACEHLNTFLNALMSESVNSSLKVPDTAVTYKRSLGQTPGVNILGLITICSAVGAAANKLLPKDSAFLSFFHQGQQVVLLIMGWLTWTTPLGVASLVAQSIAGVSNLGTVFYSIGRLVAVVITGVLFHQFVTLPLILAVLWRRNPFPVLAKCTKSFFVAFAATSTSVALPHMLDACKEIGLSTSVSRFAVPMSVTLHADASALYIATAAMFVAQTSGEENLDAASTLVIAALSSILSMAIPGVPSASIVTVVIILTSLNCPLHGIALLFTVEWLLDRMRSGVNGTSHIMCAVYTDVICNGRNPPPEPEVKHVQGKSNGLWDMELQIEEEPWLDKQREERA